MLYNLICAVIGYLLGSVCVAVIFTTRRFGADVRTSGSGNAGATNVARVFGMSAGLVTLVGDMAKTALSGLVGWLIGGASGLAFALAGCFIGHCWPLYFSFKGGKGVSVSACIALLLDWRMFLVLIAVFFTVFVLSRKVSLCSIISALLYPGLYYLFNRAINPAFFVCCLIAVGVTFLHRSNIRRLLRGEEAPFKPSASK